MSGSVDSNLKYLNYLKRRLLTLDSMERSLLRDPQRQDVDTIPYLALIGLTVERETVKEELRKRKESETRRGPPSAGPSLTYQPRTMNFGGPLVHQPSLFPLPLPPPPPPSGLFQTAWGLPGHSTTTAPSASSASSTSSWPSTLDPSRVDPLSPTPTLNSDDEA